MRRNLDASIKDIEADLDALAQITDPERPGPAAPSRPVSMKGATIFGGVS